MSTWNRANKLSQFCLRMTGRLRPVKLCHKKVFFGKLLGTEGSRHSEFYLATYLEDTFPKNKRLRLINALYKFMDGIGMV